MSLARRGFFASAVPRADLIGGHDLVPVAVRVRPSREHARVKNHSFRREGPNIVDELA